MPGSTSSSGAAAAATAAAAGAIVGTMADEEVSSASSSVQPSLVTVFLALTFILQPTHALPLSAPNPDVPPMRTSLPLFSAIDDRKQVHNPRPVDTSTKDSCDQTCKAVIAVIIGIIALLILSAIYLATCAKCVHVKTSRKTRSRRRYPVRNEIFTHGNQNKNAGTRITERPWAGYATPTSPPEYQDEELPRYESATRESPVVARPVAEVEMPLPTLSWAWLADGAEASSADVVRVLPTNLEHDARRLHTRELLESRSFLTQASTRASTPDSVSSMTAHHGGECMAPLPCNCMGPLPCLNQARLRDSNTRGEDIARRDSDLNLMNTRNSLELYHARISTQTELSN